MAYEQEDSMAVATPSLFTQVIQDHLELKRRNAALEHEMPIQRYMADDPFENHPLFKTEEQARVEDTMDEMPSIVDESTSLDWPSDATLIEPPPQAAPETASEEEQSDESLWTRSRDFDWGD